MFLRWLFLVSLLVALSTCIVSENDDAASKNDSAPRAILLVTMDTTRADRVGYEYPAVATPNLDRLAEGGTRFSQAYATAPITLPSHASMLTGLYPFEHGIHENARTLPSSVETASSRLKRLGYQTAAFVSAYPLDAVFGLARGFDTYDDALPEGRAERSADATTDRVLAFLEDYRGERLFLWVHYFDPHNPYQPPEPFKSRYAEEPYLGEIAFMDRELGRLLNSFHEKFADREHQIIAVGDHGEGLGEHGESYHGRLLYQGTMRVPLILSGTGISPAVTEEPVSIRRVYHTLLGWAGERSELDLRNRFQEVVLGEAMKPFMLYGWSPQVMAVSDSYKYIRTQGTEIYDLETDPVEANNLTSIAVPEAVEAQLEGYPVPVVQENTADLAAEDVERLASLGYTSVSGLVAANGALPRPADKTHLFADLDLGSDLFVRARYAEAIPVFEKVAEGDPANFMVNVRLAVAYSILGHETRALDYFREAGRLSPDSADLRHYIGMHYFRFEKWDQAAAHFEYVLGKIPAKLQAMECLARIRESQGRMDEAIRWYAKAAVMKRDDPALFLKLGDFYMSRQQTDQAIAAFESAKSIQGRAFSRHLELGVCYLAVKSFTGARDSLDQVETDHPGFAMALFKRAQVSVLLNEPDAPERVQAALRHANPVIRRLIENEPLFRGLIN